MPCRSLMLLGVLPRWMPLLKGFGVTFGSVLLPLCFALLCAVVRVQEHTHVFRTGAFFLYLTFVLTMATAVFIKSFRAYFPSTYLA